MCMIRREKDRGKGRGARMISQYFRTRFPSHDQLGSPRSTWGVTTALRSAKGSFSSSSSSDSESLLSLLLLLPRPGMER